MHSKHQKCDTLGEFLKQPYVVYSFAFRLRALSIISIDGKLIRQKDRLSFWAGVNR